MNPFQISDLLIKILFYIEDAKTYKICRLVSSSWLTAVGNDRIDEFANHLETIVKLYPDLDWNWDALSDNPVISTNFIQNHNQLKWSYYRIITREDIDLKDIQDIIPLYIMKTSEITTGVTFNYFVIKNISLNWDPDILNAEMLDSFWLSKNKNLTIEYFKSMKNKINFYLDKLLRNPNLHWQEVLDNWDDDCDWAWGSISTNPNITIEKIFADKQKKWYWYTLSNNKYFFQTGPMHKIWEFIINHLEYNWDWDGLSKNISWNIIVVNLDNPKYKWKWPQISMNWTVTTKIIEENPHLPWNWNWIFYNPNLTFRFIIKHKDKINPFNLSYNTFGYDSSWRGY